MSKKILKLLIFFLPGVFLVIICLIFFANNKVKFGSEALHGNTTGNLYNGGYFCEYEDTVYFANSYDNYALYSMSTDESNCKKLKSCSCSYLNADENYLYCYLSGSSDDRGLSSAGDIRGIYRINKNGKKATSLERCNVTMLTLYGNTLYYDNYDNETHSTLRSCLIDSSDKKTLYDYPLQPTSVHNGVIFINGTKNNHYLYSLQKETGQLNAVLSHNMFHPIITDQYIYFIDLETHYNLCRYSLATSTIETLTEERVDLFNVYGDVIFYQTVSDEPALKRMSSDGTNQEVAMYGSYSNINMTSRYTYFNEFHTPNIMYHTPTFGALNITTFDAAKEAAMDNSK